MNQLAKPLVLLLVQTLLSTAVGQSTSAKHGRSQSTATTPSEPKEHPPAETGKALSEDFGSRVAQMVVNDTSDPDDHVRCFFTLKQLMDLRPIPSVPKLTEADQSRVLTGLLTGVQNASDKDLTPSQKKEFIGFLAGQLDGQLVGKTPGEALATIMNKLYEITVKEADPTILRTKAVQSVSSTGNTTFADALGQDLDSQPQRWNKPNDPKSTVSGITEVVAQIPGKLAAATELPTRQTASDLSAPAPEMLAAAKTQKGLEEATVQKALQYGGKSFALTVQEQLNAPNRVWFKANDPKGSLGGAASIVQRVPEATLDAARKIADRTTAELHQSDMGTQLSGEVIASARTAINKFARPDDIGCAYQIMSWNQSRLLFGRSVANDFISVQVTVRNLNPKEEFVVHNAMLSIDTDIRGAAGRYFEGADKIAVEAYNNAGESLTARGIIGNSIAAASGLLSALVSIVDTDNFSNAASAFTSGVVPGWKTISPDHQKDQLLLIANSGFSATYTTKTVVGKSGTATFYTWFPAKPFLQGWWLQDCAQSVETFGKDSSPTQPATAGTDLEPPQIGVDYARVKEECQTAKEWKMVPYKKWTPISDDLFRELSLTVVAGIHVQEDSKKQSLVTEIRCPDNAQGELDVSKSSADGTISCEVSGNNLDKVVKLRLENAENAVDPLRPEAIVTVNGDNTTAKAAFRVSDLATAGGSRYNAYAVGKDGTETPTGQTIHLPTGAILTAVVPPGIDLADPPSKIELNGYHLDKLANICLSQGPSPAGGATIAVSKDSVTKATFGANALKVPAGTWHIYLDGCDKNPGDSEKSLQISGASPAAVDSPVIEPKTPVKPRVENGQKKPGNTQD